MSIFAATCITLIVVILYSLMAKRLASTIITLPMIFAFTGFALSQAMPQELTPNALHDVARTIAEIALIIVLFTDASHVRFQRLKSYYHVPLRMLAIGIPLKLLFGTTVILLLTSGLGWTMALLTAAILTPTDAALGQSVTESPDVPPNLASSINVESGLNDGLVLPFVLIGAIFSASNPEGMSNAAIAMEALREVILGPLAGITVGACSAWAIGWAWSRNYTNPASAGVAFVATAFLAYAAAKLIGGNGFISAFVAGAVFGNCYRHDIGFIGNFMEGHGRILTLAAFLIFGFMLAPDGLAAISWKIVLVAILFLTIVRMLPIYIALTGTGLALRDKLFLGWFGPRGLASILFVLVMMHEYELPFQKELLACVVTTVFFSIIVHGISATPLSKRIGRNRG